MPGSIVIISAMTMRDAMRLAEEHKISRRAFIYLPETEPKIRKERLRGIYGVSPTNLIGNISYEEQERICREL